MNRGQKTSSVRQRVVKAGQIEQCENNELDFPGPNETYGHPSYEILNRKKNGGLFSTRDLFVFIIIIFFFIIFVKYKASQDQIK